MKKVTRSVFINKELWRRAMRQAGGNSLSLSFIVSRLLEMWIAGEVEVKITVEPIPDEVA